jgi:hypothetical protein
VWPTPGRLCNVPSGDKGPPPDKPPVPFSVELVVYVPSKIGCNKRSFTSIDGDNITTPQEKSEGQIECPCVTTPPKKWLCV